eukprot:TRINITY_DN5930_c0_g2_i9.p1 TRINITY_DN5930_c0_g2~~TRINITY_DN5930_c0_g2_i9.p1  ORF type:complete len:433 (+),score=-18.93 TRINITY_DN5930_c0_g2_i9:1058-2356(+)
MIRYILTLTLFSTLSFSMDLSSLLQSVQNDSKKEMQAEKDRLQTFIDNKEKQKELLIQTEEELKKEDLRTEQLKKLIEEKEKVLAKKEEELKIKAANLGEIFGSVRQTSSDFLINFQSSLTASEDSNKEEQFLKLSNSKKLANIQELKEFWHSMLDEIIKSGNIAQYDADVILASGEKTKEKVTRVGLFAATSNGKYLTYSNDMKSLVELTVQPSGSAVQLAKDFESSNEISNIIIDPTRGTLFEMIANNPTIMDRLTQGGIVGYIILILGALGLLFALFKMIILNISSIKIKKQMKNISEINQDNSLGKIANIFYENSNNSINDLEIKIGQAILKETTQIKKGQSFVKLLAAVTPLLGLLGTVTGMIEVFDVMAITGSSDVKSMANGVSMATIPTMAGMAVALSGILFEKKLELSIRYKIQKFELELSKVI